MIDEVGEKRDSAEPDLPMVSENTNSWSPSTKYIVAGLALLATIAFLVFARVLVASMVIAALIASILAPIADFLTRNLKLNKRLAGTITYCLFLILLGLSVAWVVPTAMGAVQDISTDTTNLSNDIRQILRQNHTVWGVDLPISSWIDSVSTDAPSFIVPQNILSIFSNLSTNLLWVTISMVTIYYLLQERDQLREWAFSQAPEHRQRDIRMLYDDIRQVWQNYLRGQLVLSVLVGVITGVGVAAVGLRGAWAIGILAGVLDVIPTLGPAISAVAGTLVAYFFGSSVLDLPNLWFALVIIGIYGLVQTAENFWWRPRILGSSLKMHPGLVFVGVMASIALAGVFVTLIVVPMMATIGVLWRYTRARMLGLEPWPMTEPVKTEAE